jgi:oligoribonuclease (3'-5' exoribonuclease)
MYTDCMVDIETNGTDPDRSSIIQICAVKFNLETRDVSPDIFNKCLAPRKRRDWDSDTKAWWSKMPDLHKSIVARMEKPLDVFQSLTKWVGYDNLRFWGKPTIFDFSFIDSYYKDYDMENPFHWRSARDLNSYMAGLRHNPAQPDVSDIPFVGTEHDAKDDTLHQIKLLFTMSDRNGHFTCE